MSAAPSPTHAELAVLDGLQRDLPLVARPFAAAAAALGRSEDEVLAVLRRARAAGWLVRVGPVFRPGRVGRSTLAAMAVPPERVDEVAALVSSYDEVNHNYLRDHPTWNLWFVVTAADEARMHAVLAELSARAGLEVLELPLVREHHIDLAFPLLPSSAPLRRAIPSSTPARAAPPLPALAERLIAALQDGAPLVERPFAEVADRLEVAEADVIEALGVLVARGDVRRVGAVLNHRALGIAHNAMCVFSVDGAVADAPGALLAELPYVTLCYQRRAAPPRWPYTLYCMIHGTSADQVRALAERAARHAGLADVPRAVLFSTRCFKQRGARYRPTPGAPAAARARPAIALDDVDRRLVNLLQDGIPVDDHPYRAAAGALGVDEDEVVRRIASLLERGALSRFGPMYDVERFGGHFTLVAVQAPPERVDEVAAVINEFPEVAHNYQREHALNLWFVLATENPARAQEVLREIEAATGLATLDLPRERTYHLGLRLTL